MVTPPIYARPQREALPIGARRLLLSGQRTAFYYHQFRGDDEGLAREFWIEHRDEVVAHFAVRWAGQRPPLWWRWDAPSPRLRLGGIGDRLWDVLSAVEPSYQYGVPQSFLTVWQAKYYGKGTPISAVAPPRYESSPAYLRRLKLLLPGERERIPDYAFSPVVVRMRGDLIRLEPWL
jgi:hypothetical protein